MTSSVPLDIPSEVSEIFARWIAAEYAYYTPAGEPLCWPVTPYWYPERGVLAVATGLAYPKKADYAKRNPRVALYFSDPRSSGLTHPPRVLVRGDATVLEDDLQANTDRYVRELRTKFPQARIGLNPVTVKLLDFYLPRLWIEITPSQIEVEGDGAIETLGGPAITAGTRESEWFREASRLSHDDQQVLRGLIAGTETAVLTTVGLDAYPMPRRTEVALTEDGLVEVEPGRGRPGPGALLFHHHRLGGTSFEASMLRGTLAGPEDTGLFIPRRLVHFFGNGSLFPISAIPRIRELRRNLYRELRRRGKAMPRLRVL